MAGKPGRSGPRPKPPEERRATIGISLAPETRALFDAVGAGKHRIADAILREGLSARLAGEGMG